MEVKYKYECERCENELLLERPVEEFMFRVHESCPNHELVFLEEVNELPTCSVCKEKMGEGYVFNDGEEYYCTKKCLQTKYTMEEYKKAYHEGYGFWTAWI